MYIHDAYCSKYTSNEIYTHTTITSYSFFPAQTSPLTLTSYTTPYAPRPNSLPVTSTSSSTRDES